MPEHAVPGAVTDRRPEARRQRAIRSYIGDFEHNAARIVALVTRGHVTIQDDGSQDSMPDLRIDYPAKPRAYVEVTVDINEEYAEMAAQVLAYSPFPADWAWRIHIDVPSPKLKELRVILAKHLGHLHEPPSAELRQKLTDMGLSIYGPWPPGPNVPAGIHVRAEGVTGSTAPGWDTYLSWIRDFLSSEQTRDVREKLAATHAPERHAFIATSLSSPGDAYFALSKATYPHLPSRDPDLPTEITHLWTWSQQLHNRCLAWLPSQGWIDVKDHTPGTATTPPPATPHHP
ncbi:MAG TPA: hypothetical protein VGH27_33490 [Streptosporangiaceae bacterium]|jgi:hypothetical protein